MQRERGEKERERIAGRKRDERERIAQRERERAKIAERNAKRENY